MVKRWKPSIFSALLSKENRWELIFSDERFTLFINDRQVSGNIEDLGFPKAVLQESSASVVFIHQGEEFTLGGLKDLKAKDLESKMTGIIQSRKCQIEKFIAYYHSKKIWGPSTFGRLFTLSSAWTCELTGNVFIIKDHSISSESKFSVIELDNVKLDEGFFWSKISFLSIELKGISDDVAKELYEAVKETVRFRISGLDKFINNWDPGRIKAVRLELESIETITNQSLRRNGWLTQELKNKISSLKPLDPELDLLLPDTVEQSYLGASCENFKEYAATLDVDLIHAADIKNEEHFVSELEKSKAFFSSVEKTPLSEEQTRAVVCFDNSVLLVASAGSGKTSTMVAKAGYALSKGYFKAHKILLLAFNKDAALELGDRIKSRLAPLGLSVDDIDVKTFHSFGLGVIGKATGTKPSLPAWLGDGKDIEILSDIAKKLRKKDDVFRSNWDMFQLVLGQGLPKFGEEMDSPDSYDRVSSSKGFWTSGGDIVKSRGELIIANWLFYNGVEYVYEKRYEFDVADEDHGHYHPDFYFPGIDVYLEHWGVDSQGNPPPSFRGYKESMVWKRKLHLDKKTTLLETTMADLRNGKAFIYLTKELTERGIRLNLDRDRTKVGRKPIENRRLARIFRSFLTHTKSNQLTMQKLRDNLALDQERFFSYRDTVFLDIFEKIWGAWEERLRDEECIDFDDMLNQATDSINSENWVPPYDLIMVDEFQDSSHARSRLILSLLKGGGKCFFAVGDDWQSINRYAGADLSVMTNFKDHFGSSTILKLENSYRCPQSLSDISSKFIQKNPNQIAKKVFAQKADVKNPLFILRLEKESEIKDAVRKRVDKIISSFSGDVIKICVLGRYRAEEIYCPTQYDKTKAVVKFITVHSSKGLEADHVILPKMTSETLGFPSRVNDDPVMGLAMPNGDSFEFSEERRLFYVALTRAKLTVTLITLQGEESPFIKELIKDHELKVFNLKGDGTPAKLCPKCSNGFLVDRISKFGKFISCSEFPKCDYKHNDRIN